MPPPTAAGKRVIKEILNARTAADIARCYIFPMPTQVGPHLHVYHSPKELAQGFIQVAQAKSGKGLTSCQPRIVAVELPRNNRFRVWVDWLYADQAGNPCTGDRSIYFCSTFRGRVAVEMIQCAPQAQSDTANYSRNRALA